LNGLFSTSGDLVNVFFKNKTPAHNPAIHLTTLPPIVPDELLLYFILFLVPFSLSSIHFYLFFFFFFTHSPFILFE